MLSHELHNQLQRDYYRGELKERIAPVATPYVLRHVEEVVRFGGLRPGERVLDAGCGAGRHAFLLADRGMRVEGLELSPVLCACLRRLDGGRYNIPVHCGDVNDPPAELAAGFDAVAGFFMLHHLDDLISAFRGLRRVLRPGGRAVFLEPNAWNPLYYLQVTFTPGMRWAAEKGIPDMRCTVLSRALLDAGFRNPTFETFGFLPPFLRNLRGGGAAEYALERLPGIARVRPFLLMRAQAE